MSWTGRFIAPTLLSLSAAAPLRAEPTLGPPAWQDDASVYLRMSQENAAKETVTVPLAEDQVKPIKAQQEKTIAAQPIVDAAVTPAGREAPSDVPAKPASSDPPKTNGRFLPPPSDRMTKSRSDGQTNVSASTSRPLLEFGVPMQSMYTVACALAIVIGSFLLFAWALRRGSRVARRKTAQLPAEVVSVLGRVPLAARQFAELLRVGNKLVLVSFTPAGVETLTEVNDPAEVDRLVGLCQQHNPFSTTKAFEQVFRQMSDEPVGGGFLGNEPPPMVFAAHADAYRANRGGRSRG
jgi:flagellar biogenesis protein FliO